MSRCDDETHAAEKWLYTLAPDISELRKIGDNSIGEWLNCPWCSTTLLVLAPLPPADGALRVTL